jgi:hypothetical protein
VAWHFTHFRRASATDAYARTSARARVSPVASVPAHVLPYFEGIHVMKSEGLYRAGCTCSHSLSHALTCVCLLGLPSLEAGVVSPQILQERGWRLACCKLLQAKKNIAWSRSGIRNGGGEGEEEEAVFIRDSITHENPPNVHQGEEEMEGEQATRATPTQTTDRLEPSHPYLQQHCSVHPHHPASAQQDGENFPIGADPSGSFLPHARGIVCP